ncbi:MAG: CHAT domain-containing protein [Rhodospirillales bacterium]|nr:CHAT domain-containing protein [Rhodospirillales bacterium]
MKKTTGVRRLGLVLALLATAPALAAPADRDGDGMMRRRATESSAERLLDPALLDSQIRVAEARALVDQPPPETTHAQTLADFYYRRGIAATLVGRQPQVVRDLRQAIDYSRQNATINRADAYYQIGLSLLTSSRALAAVREFEAALAEDQPLGAKTRVLANLVQSLSQLGQIDKAKARLALLKDTQQELAANGRIPRNNQLGAQGNVPWGEFNILQAEGKYAEAEAKLREAMAIWAGLPNTIAGNVLLIGNMRRQLAYNLRLQGRLAEAENEARQSLVITQQILGPDSHRTAMSLSALSVILADQGRAKEAEALARRTVEINQKLGHNKPGGALLTLANALIAQYQWPEAMAQIDLARQGFGDDRENFEIAALKNPAIPLVFLKTGHHDEALVRIERLIATNRAALGETAYPTAEGLGLRGVALATTGKKAEALADFAAATPILIAGSGESDDEVGNRARDQRLRLILEAQIDLLLSIRGTPLAATLAVDPVAESFRLADTARGRSVQRALSASAARMAANSPALAEIARREQDIQKNLSALSGLMANTISAPAEEQDSKRTDELRARIDRLRQERAAILKRIEAEFPDYAKLIAPRPTTVADVQARLKPGEAMLAFYSAENAVYTWSIPAQGAPVASVATLGRLDLESRILHLRRSLDLSVQSIDEIPDFDLAAAHDLFAALLGPSRSNWDRADTLFVVPHGPLAELPLALLPTERVAAGKAAPAVPFAHYKGVPWLARKAAVAQLPSAGALGTVRALAARPAAPRRFLAFGDPLFSKDQAEEARNSGLAVAMAQRGAVTRRNLTRRAADFTAELAQLPRLPDTAEEVQSIAQALAADPEKDLFLGARASDARVSGLDLTQWRIIMFATHGLVPGDLAGLDQPALAMSAPEVAGDGGSGLLTMERIMRLKLDADWVVLSACNTASGEGAGAEAVSGLGRAFFYAGARALLVSNWPVETVSARLLTTDLFRRQVAEPTLTRARALQQAMLALLDGRGPLDSAGKEQFSYAHPTFWAPFSLVGDGGGSFASP